MAWLRNFNTKAPIPASQLKWNSDSEDARSVSDMINAVALTVYPVGSIYMSVSNTNPATIFGGTWEQLKDRFLLGAGDTYNNADTGGEAEHTLTTAELPAHSHTIAQIQSSYEADGYGLQSGGGFVNRPIVRTSGTVNNETTRTTGSGTPHNNMPPYLVVYMWKRTA